MEDKSGIIRIKEREGTFVFYDGEGLFSISSDSSKHNLSLWFTAAELVDLKAAIETALEKSEE